MDGVEIYERELGVQATLDLIEWEKQHTQLPDENVTREMIEQDWDSSGEYEKLQATIAHQEVVGGFVKRDENNPHVVALTYEDIQILINAMAGGEHGARILGDTVSLVAMIKARVKLQAIANTMTEQQVCRPQIV